MKLLSVFGTRPEAVKMAPVLAALDAEPHVDSRVCITGQHREMLDQALDYFRIAPDFDLRLMERGQGLNSLLARAMEGLDRIYAEAVPDRVLVHGDTTTALAATLAAFHRRIPVAHVEAGLRTGRPGDPFPEETNRRAIDMVADLLFAPTSGARSNLLAESVPGRIFVTGNSGIDALYATIQRLDRDPVLGRHVEEALPKLDAERRVVLATAHRRESFGAPFRRICAALLQLAARGDVEIVFPLHPNPNLAGPAERLKRTPGVHVVPPQGPAAFVALLRRADLVMTDSGGVQEEAAALGRPTLVLRNATEREEAVRTGTARLAGTGTGTIVRHAAALLDSPAPNRSNPAPNPFGDGRAAARIVAALLGRPVAEFDFEGKREYAA